MVEPETPQDGFTLLEVLIALTIISLMFTGIFGFVGQLGNINRISQSSSETNELEFLERYLHNTVSNSQQLPILSEGFLKQHYLVGDSAEVIFVGKARTGINGIGLFDITLKHDPIAGTFIEERRLRRFTHETRQDVQRYVLLEDVERMSISYLGIAESNEKEWHNSWRAERKLPAALKIQMKTRLANTGRLRNFHMMYNF